MPNLVRTPNWHSVLQPRTAELKWSSCLSLLSSRLQAHTMLFLLLWLYSIVWSQVLWYLHHCSFCSVLPWLFTFFCASIWTLWLSNWLFLDEITAFTYLQK
jgi:hypothetical protein